MSMLWPKSAAANGGPDCTFLEILYGSSSKPLARAHGRVLGAGVFDRYMRDNDQLAATAAYIEENPVKAGLCREPAAWPYSSASRR